MTDNVLSALRVTNLGVRTPVFKEGIIRVRLHVTGGRGV